MKRHGLTNVFTASLLAASIVVTSLSGCAPKAKPQGNADSSKKEGGIVSAKITDKPITLTYLSTLQHADVISSYGDIEAFKEIEKRTGVHIEWNHPSDAAQNIKLVIASNDLPDIIQANTWNWFPGSPDKLIEDKVILKLNDLIDKNAPNFKKLLNKSEELSKLAKTDTGNIYSFFKLNNVEADVFAGPQVRKDLLEKYNLPVPETIDEWYKLLKTMKDDGVEVPLMLEVSGWNAERAFGSFISAYGIGKEFYLSGNKVMYAPYQSQYKDYLTTIRKWFEEGLIPKNWNSLKAADYNSMGTSGKIGAAASVTNFGSYVAMAAPFPVLKKGETPKTLRKVGLHGGNPAVITTSCKYQTEAVKWFDYCYSDEGAKLLNWGVEGLNYKMENGKAMMTEVITVEGNSRYKYHYHNGAFLVFQDNPLNKPEDTLTEAAIQNKKNTEVWSKADTSMAIPALTLTSEEQNKYDAVMQDLNEYVNQMYIKFTTGAEPLSNFDSYISTLKGMGIEDVIKIQQAAYDRFLKR